MERRDFLAAAAAATALGRLPAAGKLGDIGLATITVAKGMTEQPAKTLDAVAEIGYTEIGLSQLYGSTAAQIEEMLKKSGLRCPVLHLPWADLSDANFPAALERCHILLDLRLTPMGDSTGFTSVTQWVAPTQFASRQPPPCERERAQLVERIELTIEPPAP